jgi:hypothetical protein
MKLEQNTLIKISLVYVRSYIPCYHPKAFLQSGIMSSLDKWRKTEQLVQSFEYSNYCDVPPLDSSDIWYFSRCIISINL